MVNLLTTLLSRRGIHVASAIILICQLINNLFIDTNLQIRLLFENEILILKTQHLFLYVVIKMKFHIFFDRQNITLMIRCNQITSQQKCNTNLKRWGHCSNLSTESFIYIYS